MDCPMRMECPLLSLGWACRALSHPVPFPHVPVVPSLCHFEIFLTYNLHCMGQPL